MRHIFILLVLFFLNINCCFAGGNINSKKVEIIKNDYQEYVFFGVDFYGNKCAGGLCPNTEQGIQNHVLMLMSNGPAMTQEQELMKFIRVMIRKTQLIESLKNDSN